MVNQLSPEQQAVQIVSTWKAIDEAQRTDSLLRYYIVLAIKDAAYTVEERTVIEAAVARYEANLRSGEVYFEYDDDLDKAVSQLLTARTRKDT